jgi:hypothetical protein
VEVPVFCFFNAFIIIIISYEVFKGKINCYLIMDIVGIREPARQIEFFTLNVSGALRHSPSTRCVIAANDKQIFGHFQQKQSLS